MSADLLTRVIAAGLPAELVAEIARLEQRAALAEQMLEGRRRGERKRKQEQREREAAERHVSSRDIMGQHVTERDVTAEPAPASPPLPSPQSPQPTPPLHPHPDNTPVHEREAAPAGGPAKPTAKRRWPKDMPPPEGVSDEQWAGFVAHRAAKRQPLTPRAYELLVNKLAAHACDERPPGALIDLIVERGWLTFEPDWLTKLEHRHGQRPDHNRSRTRGLLGAVLDAEHEGGA
jgi:hypothetical protein